MQAKVLLAEQRCVQAFILSLNPCGLQDHHGAIGSLPSRLLDVSVPRIRSGWEASILVSAIMCGGLRGPRVGLGELICHSACGSSKQAIPAVCRSAGWVHQGRGGPDGESLVFYEGQLPWR